MSDTELLESILASQVLLLGRQIKAENASKGGITSDCVVEAIKEILTRKANIVSRLREIRERM